MTTPLVYTSLGNLPMADLTRKVEWQFTPTQITLVETYADKSGEIVRQGADVFVLPRNMTLTIDQGML